MKLFAILISIAIGNVFCELERDNFEKEKLKVNENVIETVSRVSHDDTKQPNIPVENLRVTYTNRNVFGQSLARAKDTESVEEETLRNPLPVMMTSTVKPNSSKATKNLEIIYLRRPAKHFKVLRKIVRLNATNLKPAKKLSIDLHNSFLRDRDVISHEETNLPSNTRKFRRGKRMADSEDPVDAQASYKVYIKLREKLPLAVRLRVRDTDKADEALLESYATSKSDSGSLTAKYNAAKTAEREQLKLEVSSAGSGGMQVIDDYKALRKGTAWNYVKRRKKFKAFFTQPSAALTEYEALKLDELASIDSFLSGSNPTESKIKKEDNEIMTIMKAKEGAAEVSAGTEAATHEKSKMAEAKKDETEESAGTEETSDAKLLADAKEEKTDESEDDEEKADEKPKMTEAKEEEKDKSKDDEEKADEKPKMTEAKKEAIEVSAGVPSAQTVRIEDPDDISESYSKYLELSSEFNRDLKVQMMNTDSAEKRILSSYVQADYAPKHFLDKYYEARKKEIELLKEELAAAGPKAPQILASYKAARKGTIWNFLKNEDNARREYFMNLSAGRLEYDALKTKELDIDRYLDGSLELEDKAPEKGEKAKAAELQRASDREKEKAKEEEDDRSRAEAAIKKGEDAVTLVSSFLVMKHFRSKLPDEVRGKLRITDDAEEKLIESYTQTNSVPSNLLAEYTEAKTKEREALKEATKAAGDGAPDMIANYKVLRKGSVWNYIKLQAKFRLFFIHPSTGRAEYEELKRDELSIDSFLKGPSQAIAVNANKEAKIEEAYRIVRAKGVVERSRAEEEDDERTEELERGMRDKDIETLEVEESDFRENPEDTVASTDETEGPDEIHGRHDDVTSADAANTETTNTKTEDKESGTLVRTGIFFALAMQVTIAVLILGPHMGKLVEWCKRMKRAEAEETEPLYTGRMASATGTAPKISKSALNTAAAVSNQGGRV